MPERMTATDTLRFGFLQIESDAAGFETNRQRIWQEAQALVRSHPDLDMVVTPELALAGYPYNDLGRRQSFQDQSQRALHTLAQQLRALGLPAAIIGAPDYREGRCWLGAYCEVFGESSVWVHKRALACEDCFHDHRIFTAGAPEQPVFSYRGRKIGILICEDLWKRMPLSSTVEAILILSASPFAANKFEERLALARHVASQHRAPLFYLGRVGAQDGLVFDGRSFALNPDGSIFWLGQSFARQSSVLTLDFTGTEPRWRDAPPSQATQDWQPLYWQGMISGLRSYFEQNHFQSVCLGLSGGIDSALTATLAVDALGASRVDGFHLPSVYTSTASQHDSAQLATNLGIELHEIPITEAQQTIATALTPAVALTPIAHQNIQARIRAVILMAIANSRHALLLATGNKSELATGYTTLYGDMSGGFSVLGDVYKTQVYQLAHWRNQQDFEPLAPIPPAIIEKAPTAELCHDQKDTDVLPPYPELDRVLTAMIEQQQSQSAMVESGLDPATVDKVWRMFVASAYKRQQACLSLRLSSRHLNLDWMYPVTYHLESP